MADYAELMVEFRFDEIINTRLNTISIYASKDGLHWEAIPEDATYRAVYFSNSDHAFQYLKAVANVTFFSNGRIRWNYTRIEGEKDATTNTNPVETGKTVETPVTISKQEDFSIYSYSKTINVVSYLDEDYTILITNMSGQIVHREKANGNRRIDTEFPDGLYIVHILRNDKVVSVKKVVL